MLLFGQKGLKGMHKKLHVPPDLDRTLPSKAASEYYVPVLPQHFLSSLAKQKLNAVPCSYFDLVLVFYLASRSFYRINTQNGREATADDTRIVCLSHPAIGSSGAQPQISSQLFTQNLRGNSKCHSPAQAITASTASIGRLFSTVSKTHDVKHGSEAMDGC
jgi:hypothetical protein